MVDKIDQLNQIANNLVLLFADIFVRADKAAKNSGYAYSNNVKKTKRENFEDMKTIHITRIFYTLISLFD